MVGVPAADAVPLVNPNVARGEPFAIGVLMPLHDPWHACSAIAAQYAANDINNGSVPTMGPNQTRLLPNNTIRLYFNNSRPTMGLAMQSVLGQMEDHRVMGVVGEMSSGITLPLATLLSAFATPIVSPQATVRDLSNKALFPFFARTVGGDDQQAYALHSLLLYFRWHEAQIIYATDTYGTAFAAELRAMANSAHSRNETGVSFSSVISFQTGSAASIHQAVNAMEADGAIIVVLLASYTGDARIMAVEMARRGLIGRFQFVGVDGWFHTGLLAGTPSHQLQNLTSFVAGVVGTMLYQPSSPQALDLNRRIDGDSPPFNLPFERAAIKCSTRVGTITSYAYDAVLLLARAASRSLTRPSASARAGILSGVGIMAEILSGDLSMEGMVGSMTINTEGDPFAKYTILNRPFGPTGGSRGTMGLSRRTEDGGGVEEDWWKTKRTWPLEYADADDDYEAAAAQELEMMDVGTWSQEAVAPSPPGATPAADSTAPRGKWSIQMHGEVVFYNGARTPPSSLRPRGIHQVTTETTFYGLLAGSLFAVLLIGAWPLGVVTYNREHMAIKSGFYSLTALMLVGALIGCVYPAVASIPLTASLSAASVACVCMFPPLIVSISLDIIVGSLATKLSVVHRITRNKGLKIVTMSAWEALKPTVCLLALDTLLFALWGGLDTPFLVRKPWLSSGGGGAGDSNKDLQDYYTCSQHFTIAWQLTVMLPKFALLATTSFLAFRVRDASHAFGEARFIGLVLYNLLFISVLGILLINTLSDPTVALGVATLCVWYSLAASVGLIVLPKMLIIIGAQRSRRKAFQALKTIHRAGGGAAAAGTIEDDRHFDAVSPHNHFDTRMMTVAPGGGRGRRSGGGGAGGSILQDHFTTHLPTKADMTFSRLTPQPPLGDHHGNGGEGMMMIMDAQQHYEMKQQSQRHNQQQFLTVAAGFHDDPRLAAAAAAPAAGQGGDAGPSFVESSPNDSVNYYSNYGNCDANVLPLSELGVGSADATASFAGFPAPIDGGGGSGDGGSAAVANSAGAIRLFQQERAQERSVISSQATGSLQMTALHSPQQPHPQLHSQHSQSMDAPATAQSVDSASSVPHQLFQSSSETAAAVASTRANSVSPSSASAAAAAVGGDGLVMAAPRRLHAHTSSLVHSHNDSSVLLDPQRCTVAAAATSSIPTAAAAASTGGGDDNCSSVAVLCVPPSVPALLDGVAGAAASRSSPALDAFVPHTSPAAVARSEQTELLHHYTAAAQQQQQHSPQPLSTDALSLSKDV